MEHKLIVEPGFRGLDGYCETCFDPDYSEGSWGGFTGIYNTTEKEINWWFDEHVLEAHS